MRAYFYEDIGKVPRERMQAWADAVPMKPGTDELDVDALTSKRWGLRIWLGELTSCPHCLGTYVSIGSVFALRYRWLRPILEGLAGAMILSVFVQWFPGFDFEEPDPADPVEVKLVDATD